MLPPVRLPGIPVRIEIRFAVPSGNGFGVSVFRTDNKTSLPRTLWSKWNFVLQPRRESKIQIYILDRYTIGMFMPGRVFFCVEYSERPPRGPLCLKFVNAEIRELEIRAIAPEEVPAFLRDPKAVIKGLGVEPVAAVAKLLRNQD